MVANHAKNIHKEEKGDEQPQIIGISAYNVDTIKGINQGIPYERGQYF